MTLKTSNANPRQPATSKLLKANAGPKVMQRILKQIYRLSAKSYAEFIGQKFIGLKKKFVKLRSLSAKSYAENIKTNLHLSLVLTWTFGASCRLAVLIC